MLEQWARFRRSWINVGGIKAPQGPDLRAAAARPSANLPLRRGTQQTDRCRHRSSPLHRRHLQYQPIAFRSRICKPAAVRGSARPADGQNRSMIMSGSRGALHLYGLYSPPKQRWWPLFPVSGPVGFACWRYSGHRSNPTGRGQRKDPSYTRSLDRMYW